MRAAEADILMVPGHDGAGPDHWQTRWERKLSTARRVEQADWNGSDPDALRANLIAQAKATKRPVVLVAHGCGVVIAVHAAPFLAGVVSGAFLVAPPDLDIPYVPEPCRRLAPLALQPLPFPSFLVASRNDPYCSFEHAEGLARAWQSLIMDVGAAGHIDAASGHGPWPEGLLLFSRLLRNMENRTGS